MIYFIYKRQSHKTYLPTVMNNNNDDFATIYIKLARGAVCNEYQVCNHWTKEDFIEHMREKISVDFGLPSVEFVDTCHELRNGEFMEDAPAMISSNDIMYDVYGERLKNMLFYIRPTVSTLSDDDRNRSSVVEPQRHMCVICDVRERSIMFSPCNHLCACSACGEDLRIETCPICRSYFHSRVTVFL